MDQYTIDEKCAELVKRFPAELLRRALSYLYIKETKSSFEIEHIKPDASRTEKFVASLKLAHQRNYCEKDSLTALHNQIVDPRFKNDDYRTLQAYVGQTISYQRELIGNYVCPKPEDLSELMEGLLKSHRLMMTLGVSAIVQAAIIAFGFVFIHPFEDGNRRIHRFLIHNILALNKLVPEGLMFPVSAVMLKNPKSYNDSLEAFSLPLKQLIEYHLDRESQMTVTSDTALWYQYIDMTLQTEVLYDFIIETIEDELIAELNFLEGYDMTIKGIQNIVDMPDRKLDLFIRFCLQNNGKLSVKKRESHFDFLSDEEIYSMQNIVMENSDRLS